MPYRKSKFQVGCYYHIYNRGNNRQLIFFERDNYLHFLRQLRRHLVSHGIDIVAYCLMPNHYHLLVYLNAENLSQRMQAFSLSYTKAINQRYQRVGSLFQGRFQAIHVNKEEYLLNLTRYIHLNPVAANLVKNAEDWEFSSCRDYLNLRPGRLPRLDRIAFESADAYQVFLEDGVNTGAIQGFTFDE
ncbi:MAG: transposase [Phormidium sp. BM_Day4_Bin.17]|nr:transposase [Phormidium sp. BM_Day4_Bin.17]UCJ11683.1 MAG: transposase [Phormidium sp. PBR-2020]